MKEFLIAISFLLLNLGEPYHNLTDAQIKFQWLGFEPATTEEFIKLKKDQMKNFQQIIKIFWK